MTKKDREYWSLKNSLGYCVLSGDTERRKEIEEIITKFEKKEVRK